MGRCYQVLRNVCREHVDLEVFLVETEAGMKARIDEERTPMSGRASKTTECHELCIRRYIFGG
jgi:hypothetical protein